MKILLKQIGFYLIFLILLTFFCSLLNLIGLNSTITNLILFIFNASMFLILGYKRGIKSANKGYYAGLKMGLILLLILVIINLIVSQRFFTTSTIIYYIVLLLCSIFGGMLGISRKKTN